MLREVEVTPDLNSQKGENEGKGNQESGDRRGGKEKGCSEVNDRNQNNKYEQMFHALENTVAQPSPGGSVG